jgi:outer membrane lipoprotein SlyB
MNFSQALLEKSMEPAKAVQAKKPAKGTKTRPFTGEETAQRMARRSFYGQVVGGGLGSLIGGAAATPLGLTIPGALAGGAAG